MASNYTIIAQQRGVLVRSPTLVEDVEEVHAVTKPSGVSFVRELPYAAWKAKGAGPLIEPIAAHIEQIMVEWPVLSGAAVQHVDASSLISNEVEFVVAVGAPTSDQPGPMTSTVRIPVQALHDRSDFSSYFDPIISALDATAAL